MKAESVESAPSWLPVTRHFVALALVLGVLHRPVYALSDGPDAVAFLWAVKLGAVVLLSALLCGLWALFFTKRSHGKFTANYVRMMWLIGGLIAFGEWSNNVEVQVAIGSAALVGILYDWARGREKRSREPAEVDAAIERSEDARAFVSGVRPTLENVRVLVLAAQATPSLAKITDRVRGRTLLHWCAHYNLREEATVLLQLGADADAPDGNGCRPGELASEESLAHMLSRTDTPLTAGA